MKSFDLEQLPEFDDHHLVTFVYDKDTGLRGFIAIHRSNHTIPSLGATRLWNYETTDDSLRDALRLSRLMSYKAAIAGLPYGGAKAALMKPAGSLTEEERKAYFAMYAHKLNFLNGRFVTGTDVGVTHNDVATMHETTNHVIGTIVDPAHYTAQGVINALHVVFDHALGNGNFSGKRFAIQGLGKTGSKVLEYVYPEAERVYVSDISAEQLSKIKKDFPNVEVVDPLEIHRQDVDAFVPCALSGVLNSKTVSELRCKIVAGSANNQLADESIDELLLKLGITYAPDYAANAGGLISVADEMEHGEPDDARILEQLKTLQSTIAKVLYRSKSENIGTNQVANMIAEERFNNHG